MKRLIITLILTIFSLSVNAQVVSIISSDVFENSSFKLTANVVDSLTSDNLSFVSAYLKHSSDTLITNFALSDADGKVVLSEVTKGDYVLTVEYLGYHKFTKNIYVRKDTDVGTIRLKPDVKALDAATVSAAGKEVEFRQDTIIFNATMFRSGSNDNLATLLKRMPGIEISESGSVTVNGKAVDRITVEGKTFFLNDKSAALNNIPASIVDKIHVVDKDSDAARISGIKDVEKERVMDVQLKEEYKQGFFGNISLAGGAAVPGGDDNEFLVTGKGLFNSSLLASLYDEKDQITVIGNAQNVSDGNNMVVVVYGDDQVAAATLPYDGVHTGMSTGINVNTDRIKSVASTFFARYSEDNVDRRGYTDKTSYQFNMDDLRELEDSYVTGKQRSTSFNAELKRVNGKVFSFSFTPSIKFSSLGSDNSTSGSAMSGGDILHRSSSSSIIDDSSFSVGGRINSSVKFSNNPKRRLGLTVNTSYGNGKGTELVSRHVDYIPSAERFDQMLNYDKRQDNKSINMNLSYSEPISASWVMQVTAKTLFRYSTNDRSALENGVFSDMYSSFSTTRYNSSGLRVTGQYSKNSTVVNLGADLDAKKNWIISTSNGLRTESGRGEWVYNLSPYFDLSTKGKDKKTSYRLSTSGSVSMPGASSMMPTFNIMSPTSLSLGNIYLKPYSRQNMSFSISGSTKKNSSYYIYTSGSVNSNAISNAIWYDQSNTMYSVPVNVKDPGVSFSTSLTLSTSLTEDGKLRLDLGGSDMIQSGSSYQSVGRREGFDTQDFDYDAFMREFWGSADGETFYSGDSGFKRSRTTSHRFMLAPTLKLNLDALQLSTTLIPESTVIRYTLDPNANRKLFTVSYVMDVSYQTKKELEMRSYLEYRNYYGFDDMFAEPRFSWNCSLLKNVKAFTIGLKVNDILNSARVQSQSFTENYSRYSFTNVIGRHALISLKYNFGKMNAAKNMAAQQASLNMLF